MTISNDLSKSWW